jgi:hypothetical protein
MPIGPLARALFGLIQFALFGLLTAILAFKRPYLTLDVWVRRSPHDRGLSPAMWARDWFNVGLLIGGGFFPRFNQFCHVPNALDCRLPGMPGAPHFGDHQLFTPVFTPARFVLSKQRRLCQ